MIEHLSPSGLDTWRECRLKWWWSYVERLPKAPPTVAQLTGSIVHRALEAVFSDEEVDLREAARIGWAEYAPELPEGTDEREVKDRCWQALTLLYGWWWGADVYATELEVSGTVETPEGNTATFMGKVDLVERSPLGALVVRDAKTGSPPKPGPFFKDSLDEKLRQVRLYGVFVEMQEGLPVDAMHLDFTGNGRVETHSVRTKGDALEVWTEAWDDMVRVTANGEHPEPEPGPLCGWCDFVAECPAGTAAVIERDRLNKNIGPAREVLGL